MNPLKSLRIWQFLSLSLLLLAAALPSCSSTLDPFQEPSCKGVDCSGHGECQIQGGRAICVCDQGYHADGLSCVEDANPCDGVDCSAHGKCVVQGGEATCECDTGYAPDGLSCVETCSSDAECDDDNVCTDDSCDPATGCIHQDNTSPCDDGNACTTGDLCSSGECIGGQPVTEGTSCDDGLFCNGTDTCDGAGGCRVHSGDPCGDLPCDDLNDTCSEYVWYGLGGSDTGGGVSDTDTRWSGHPSIAVDGTGDPIVSWEDYPSGEQEIYVKKYDSSIQGGAWIEAAGGSASGGGISDSTADACCQMLTLDNMSKPAILWHETTPSGNAGIFVRTYDDGFPGGAWVEVGEGSASGYGISGNLGNSFSGWLTVDGEGYPVAAWTISPPGRNNEIYVKRFDGANWVEVGESSASSGGISNNEGNSYDPTVAVDSNNLPVVAWYDSTYGGNRIYVKQFNGEAWVELGAGSASGDGISGGVGGAALPRVVIDEYDHPIITWEDDSSGNLQTYVKKFDGNNWIELGVGSASGGGISMSAGDSRTPLISLDNAGLPVVAWRDDTSGYQEVYVKRFDGNDWVEIGAGSASGGGVSNSGELSTWCGLSHYCYSTVGLGIGGGRICVAWSEWTDNQHNIMQVFLRCADE